MVNKPNKKQLKNTGERMIPEYSYGQLMYAEHVTRYQAALPFTEQKIVLDIACGTGYGTNMLASNAKKAFGVDLNSAAVGYANENFAGKNIEFITGSATNIPIQSNSIDVVITFETIEHIKNYKLFLREIDRVLKDDGILIMSTPNSLEFAKGNHFHLHEFEYQELINIIKPHFRFINSYFQGTWKSTLIASKDFISKTSEANVFTSNYAPLKMEECLYFFLVCSRRQINKQLLPIASVGERYSEKEAILAWTESNAHRERLQSESQYRIQNLEEEISNIKQEITNIYKSKTYKLAKSLSKAKHRVTGS